MAMANIKDCFYGICKHLGSDSQRLARVALGPACEHWINTEIFLALNYSDPPLLSDEEYAVAESQKRDIIIKNARDVITHHIEVKVIYSWSDYDIRTKKLEKLKGQLERTRLDEGPDGIRRIGLLFAIWISSDKEEKEAFFSRVSRLLQNEFGSNLYTTQHNYTFERKPIMEVQNVALGKDNCKVEIGAAYITKRPVLMTMSR